MVGPKWPYKEYFVSVVVHLFSRGPTFMECILVKETSQIKVRLVLHSIVSFKAEICGVFEVVKMTMFYGVTPALVHNGNNKVKLNIAHEL